MMDKQISDKQIKDIRESLNYRYTNPNGDILRSRALTILDSLAPAQSETESEIIKNVAHKMYEAMQSIQKTGLNTGCHCSECMAIKHFIDGATIEWEALLSLAPVEKPATPHDEMTTAEEIAAYYLGAPHGSNLMASLRDDIQHAIDSAVDEHTAAFEKIEAYFRATVRRDPD